ncbi:ferritin-like domain-containing protein [Kitasatospora herbaricolor]|uniref:Ferritin-like domain-containing protein n=1 Tax=Kitasatospora herbaricolor TaxID=68217 RepID=A0ABZ1WDI0_9ACTN|nr:ferritin-like domain-containing protein [Kitasatospora herbaricolor]
MQRRRRRTTLALGLLAAAAVLTACTGSHHKDGDEQRQADPDLPVRTRAVAATDALLAAYDTVIAGPGAGRAGELQPLRAELLRHRAAFAEGLPSAAPTAGGSTGASGGTGTATASAEPAATATAVTTVAELGAAERRTAQARLADLPAASPDLARLLAAVSASDALHAAALGDTTPVTAPAPAPTASASASASGPAGASTSAAASASTAPATGTGSGPPSASAAPLPDGTATALQSALAAEHAAVYGYGVVGAKLPDDQQRTDARTAFATHEARRDTWRRLLAGAGATPGAAAAGYQLPFAVADAAGAARLAAHIEARLTDVYGELVAALPADRRVAAADALRGTALQARRWGSAVTAFPGLPEPAAASPSGSAAPTPTG